jgi:hypothetical protein
LGKILANKNGWSTVTAIFVMIEGFFHKNIWSHWSQSYDRKLQRQRFKFLQHHG